MVTVVTSPSCQPCRFTKKRLTDRGIKYIERNVAEDPEALELAKSLGYKSTPVVITDDGAHWSGLRIDLIDSLVS